MNSKESERAELRKTLYVERKDEREEIAMKTNNAEMGGYRGKRVRA